MKKSLSRQVIEKNNEVIKIYDRIWAAYMFDFLRVVLSIVALQPHVDFVSAKNRIANELLAREKIKDMKLSIIKAHSDGLVLENKVNGVEADVFLKQTGNAQIAYKIGEFIGGLHKKGMALVDNRPQNYIIDNYEIFRVDLELFKINANNFDKTCDLFSFAEYFDDNEVKNAFFEGHNKLCDCKYETYIGFLSKMFLRIINCLE